MSEENAVAIKQAKKVLKEISEDEHERYLAFLRQKYIMDQKATEQAGYYKGLEARKRATEFNSGIQNVAKQLLSQGIDIKIISSVTGLSEKELEKLK